MTMENWELFFEWLLGSEEGGEFTRRYPAVVDRWLRAYHEWVKGQR